VLFVGGVGADVGDYGGEQGLGRVVAVAAEGVDEAGFAEFFVCVVHGLGYAVGVESEEIAGVEMGFAYGALPSFEQAENGGSGFETVDGVVAAQKQRAEMAAVDVAQKS